MDIGPVLGHGLDRELQVAIDAATSAGIIHREHYERLERIVHKSEKDVVTEVDHLSEAAIIEAIGAAFPGDGFLAEESGVSGSTAGASATVSLADGSVSSTSSPNGHSARNSSALIEATLTSMSSGVPGTR